MPDFGRRLTTVQGLALDRLEALVQKVEERYVPSPQRATEIREEIAEARDVLTGGTGPWPLLEVDAQVEGITVTQAAQNVRTEAQRLQKIMRGTRRFRRSYKRDIEAATTVREVIQAVAGMNVDGLKQAIQDELNA